MTRRLLSVFVCAALAAHAQTVSITTISGSTQVSASRTTINTNFTNLKTFVEALYASNAGKASLSHVHLIADVTGLQTALDGKASSSHTHAASDTTSGVFAAARLGTGTANDTKFLRGDGTWAEPSGIVGSVAWGAITGTFSDQTDLTAALALKAPLASPVFTGQPTIPDFTLAPHTHANTANGGQIAYSALTGTPTLPANTTATANQFFSAYNSTTGAFTKAQPAFSDLSGAVNDAQVPDTISLTNITQISTRSHTSLSDIGSNTHAQIDTHLSSTSNPHSVTASQVGLGNVQNYGIASQAEAEAGAATDKYMTPQRTAQAISALAAGGHTQNTDTGTDQPSFQIDSGNAGCRWKMSGGVMVLRNAADSALCNLSVGALDVGDGTIAGESKTFELTANGSNYRSWLAQDAFTATLALKHPDAVPADSVMLFPTPTSNVSTYTWTGTSGTGNFARVTSPTFVTPNLGTPSAINLTNGTALPIAGITGLAANLATWLATANSANLAAALADEVGTAGGFVRAADSSTVGQVLRVGTGPTIAFGAIDLADSDAVTGLLPDANIAAAIARDSEVAAGYLALTGGTLTGLLTTDNLGIEFNESDTNPTCAAGNYNIFADLSETKLKKCTNGTVTDLDTSGGGSAVDPATTATWVDDFGAGAFTTGTIGQLGWYLSAAGFATATANTISGSPGTVTLTTSGTINSIVGIAPVAHQVNLNPAESFTTRLKVASVTGTAPTTNVRMRFGLTTQYATPDSITNGVYLEKLEGDTNWFCVVRASSAETRVDTGVAYSTSGQALQVRRVNGTTFGCKVATKLSTLAAATEATNNATNPTTDMTPFVMIKNTAAEVKLLNIDYYDHTVSGLDR